MQLQHRKYQPFVLRIYLVYYKASLCYKEVSPIIQQHFLFHKKTQAIKYVTIPSSTIACNSLENSHGTVTLIRDLLNRKITTNKYTGWFMHPLK